MSTNCYQSKRQSADIKFGEATVPAGYEKTSLRGVGWGRFGWILPGGVFVVEQHLAEMAAQILHREMTRRA